MNLEPLRSYRRLWTIDAGTVMVVTDLHGDWDAYRRYRDRFVDLHAQGRADALVLTGDLIHREPRVLPGSPLRREPLALPDRSLDIVLDVRTLQATYGRAVVYLCGNHELPHVYGFGLSKGTVEYTPAFEAALSGSSQRSVVLELLDQLPFFVRTAAGVSLTHAGASAALSEGSRALKVFDWSHRDALARASARLAGEDLPTLRRAYARLGGAASYEALVRRYLAVEGPEDPRYDDLLRGAVVLMDGDFDLVYAALFSGCEHEYGERRYAALLEASLHSLSLGYTPQRFLVTGHIAVRGGHQRVGGRQLRLASASHALPPASGRYLLFDAGRAVGDIEELEAGLGSIYDSV